MSLLRAIILFIVFALSPRAFAQNLARFSDIEPGMIDGEIEQLAVKVANRRAVDLRCPEDYIKAVIISRKWLPEPGKNGTIRGREIHLELYCRFPEGRCAMTDMIFRQKTLEEGGYSRKLYFVAMGDMITIDCEPPNP
ncbi:MAG: hypothetical protein JWQ38_1121 [Flavipsychrobacter sp.]|nr:hypothetical protein [Flavipsychrobacter sp.]